MVLSFRRFFLAVLLATVGLIGSATEPALAQRTVQPPEDELSDAIQLFDQRMYRQAAEALDAFRRAHPDHPSTPQALYVEARAALALDRREEAVWLFEQLQENYPSHPRAEEAQLSLGQYFMDEGQTARGREIMRRIAQDDPQSPNAPRAVYLLGVAERRQGNLSAAANNFRRVLQQYPDADVAPAAAYDLATTQVRREQYEAAAQSFEQLAQRYPNSPYAGNLGTALAEVYYELGRYDRVIEELRPRTDRLQGDERTRAQFFLAEAYNQRRNTENAIVYYRRVLDAGSNGDYYRPALYGMGWNYLRSGDPRQAADYFAQVRTSGSEDLARKAAYYEGVARVEAGEPDRAQDRFQSVVEGWPNTPLAVRARYEMGVLQYQRESYRAAAASMREVIRQTRDAALLGDAYYVLGNAYTGAGNLEEALQAYDQAVERGSAPDSLRYEVQFRKAWTQYENDQYREASTAFLQLAEQGAGQRSRDALFWGADCLFQTGDYGGAQRRFRRYLDRYPDGRHAAGAQYALGWTYFRQRQYESAAQAFERFLQEYRQPDEDIPYRQDARMRLADSYYALKQYDDAVEQYRRVEGQGTDYALYQTGEALARAGRSGEAVRSLQRLVDRYPNSSWKPEALYRIGFIRFQGSEYAAARDAYRQLIQEYADQPVAARAQYGIGDTYYNAGEMSQAVTAYLTVLDRYPQSSYASEAASSLQYALIATGNEDRATAIIDSVARANPDSPIVDELRFRRAEATYQSGDVNGALQQFRRFLRTSDDESLLPEAYYYLGIIYADREQYDEAETYLGQLVDRYPDSDRRAESALRLGDVNLRQGDAQQALDAYEAVGSEDVNPELQAQAVYGQSQALGELGRRDEAEQLLQRLIDENRGGPLLQSARLGLARLYEADGRTREARNLYTTVADNSDSEVGAEALVRLGQLLRGEGQPREAIRELDRTSSLYPGYPEWVARSLLEMARAHRQLGQTGDASQLYDRVISEYGGTRFADTARQEKDAL